jgi:hypothetical protein
VLLDVILNALAIPYFQETHGNGGIGAALTTMLCEGILILVGVWLMPRSIFDRATCIIFLKVGISGGVMALIVLLARDLGIGTVPLVALGAVTYGALVLATRAVSIRDLLYIRDMTFGRFRPAKGPNDSNNSSG